ncbi:hypothetical protein RGC27_05580 [Helicobacter pylori]|uniref:hypothetical protein n=1 Tax=Helicobacter pylori TaxID=210 RepID=UPI002929757F|nr:hypothetical protein [Helicobacter pylori]MDU9793335.1 hypothetical protein [Helicobacter pylori]
MIKGLTKELVRIDNKVKIKNEQLQQVNADIYTITAKVVLLENRLDPHLLKEMTKALLRVDNNVKINNEQLQQVDADMYSIVAKVVLLEKRLKKLQQELNNLKQSKK